MGRHRSPHRSPPRLGPLTACPARTGPPVRGRPGLPDPLPSDQTVGEWEVDENGNGTLSADNPLGARDGLQAGTSSIRKVAHSFSSATALPVNPASYSLVACGEVERIAALDPATSQLPQLPSVGPVS